MSGKRSLVHGVGINDSIGKIAKSRAYRTWSHMLERCYCAATQKKKPTYIGCSVVSEWHLFSVFERWMLSQNWQGMELDKDILYPGNKVYGPNTCVFVPLALNRFLNDRKGARGEWPIGVSWHRRDKTLQAQCNNPFTKKVEPLGRFLNADHAHEAWRAKKHEHACRYADMQIDPRIAEALRARYATAGGN